MKIKKVDLTWIAIAISVILCALKLDGTINPLWIWVVSPVWILLIIAIILVIFTLIIFKK